MKEYFDSVSSNADLRFNKAFLQIYRHLHQQKIKADRVNNAIKAPVIRAKKLQSKQQPQGEIYIII